MDRHLTAAYPGLQARLQTRGPRRSQAAGMGPHAPVLRLAVSSKPSRTAPFPPAENCPQAHLHQQLGGLKASSTSMHWTIVQLDPHVHRDGKWSLCSHQPERL